MPNENDDDIWTIVNGKKVLKDGKTFRIGMRFMDSKNLDAVQIAVMRDGKTWRIGDTGQGVNRPGFRVAKTMSPGGAHLRDDLATAYRENDDYLRTAYLGDTKQAPPAPTMTEDHYSAYDSDLQNAWRGTDQNPPTGAGSHGPIGQRAGDVCMTNAKETGHLRLVNGVLTCVADRQSDAAKDARTQYEI